ncbi:MAG: DEAD/DEAH box helicase family protein, partial [Terriglobus roseus]|nr:DEAD/DEAH box helicase family protein [Terriglobus roseus]
MTPTSNMASEEETKSPPAEEQLSFLATARDQDDLERDIGRQADQLLTEQADERDKKRLEKTETSKQRFLARLAQLQRRLTQPGSSLVKNPIRDEIRQVEEDIKGLDEELGQIQKRIDERHQDGGEGETLLEEVGNSRLPNESRRDFLIRTGKITPFSKIPTLGKTSSSLADIMLEAEAEEEDEEQEEAQAVEESVDSKPMSHRNLLMPGGFDEETSDTSAVTDFPSERATKRRRVDRSARDSSEESAQSQASADESGDAYEPGMSDRQLATLGESDDSGAEAELAADDYQMDTKPHRRARPSKKRKQQEEAATQDEDLAGVDDGNEHLYQSRLQSWVRKRSEARRKAQARHETADDNEGDEVAEEDGKEEWLKPHPTRPDAVFDGGLRIPGDIYPSLFDYQKTGVQWLWELYSQQVGGIVGDEMGLGKTIQVISFLAGLHHSGLLKKPVIIVTPATVMKQWVNEFHRWWPPLRVSILHSSGSGMFDTKREADYEDELETMAWDDPRPVGKGFKTAKRIVDRVVRDGHVLVTTYSGLQSYAKLLVPQEWEYAVLDEGHKIRNPNASITIYCKEIRTFNRIILSGTPMQNNLTDLWSLFDFVYPMRLGTLVDFRQQFEFPIKQGGYANASNLQVETAMKCAETLKDTISEFLLQRFKVDVAADLPKKTERVLFCRLTKLQRDSYQKFLDSEEMTSIIDGKRNALYGVDILRKVCNHPDLVQHKTIQHKPGYNYGDPKKSGKMQVVRGLLEMWKKNGHKTLLFAQHRIMLDILEKFVKDLDGFNYRRMDGTTAIKDRQSMVDEFNRDPDLHVFLLTTKVGGLGVNLTGADRVIIYDPDWNPSTDVQARERAWRLGQKREVEIYRLMTAGTIEEKIYHRQIFKQFLTNKILKDPKQRQTFQLRDLHDLFTLGDVNDGQTETGSIFKGTEVKFKEGKDKEAQHNIPTPPIEGDAKQETIADRASTAQAVAKITGIARQADYAAPAEASAANANAGKTNEEAGTEDKPDRLLSALFSRSGVQSALEHDAILASNSGKPKITADPEIIRREARRVAAEAARELRRAGEIARTIPAGVPTWTGTVGEAGRPTSPGPSPRNTGSGRGGYSAGRGRGGPSSSSILANLQ